MENLKGKTVVITGASRGIGEATAIEFANHGAKVALCARSAVAIEKIADQIKSKGSEAIAIGCDVADHSQTKEAIEKVVAAFGTIDIMVNNAGLIDPIGRITDLDPADWGKVIDVNVKGIYHMLHAALPVMERQSSGIVVNISSGAATSILEGWSHYCASKAAALMLTRAVHKEYEANGIRAIGLSPGTVATDMQVKIKASGINPVSQLNLEDHIPAEWAAKAICWLTTDEASQFDGGDVSLRDPEIRKMIGVG